MKRLLVPLAFLLVAADWPQFRGPNRDGHAGDEKLLATWPKSGPKLLWTFNECGVGYAGPAIMGDKLFLAGGRGDDEFLFALDLAASPPKELWSAKIGPLFTWKGNSWNAGTNVSPTADGERVYVLGGFGDLLCVEASTGKELWKKNLPRDLGGAVNPIGGGLEDPTPLGWGYSAAPLIDGDKLICVPGGKKGLVAALDKKTGKLLWQSADATDEASYASPVLAEIGGVKQIVAVTNKGLLGVAAADGKVLWRHDRPYEDVAISTPIVRGGMILASVGFNEGCVLIKVEGAGGRFTATKVYSNKDLQNRDGGLILSGGLVFGHSEKGGWTCQDFASGQVKWSDPGIGRGVMSFADGKLYCVSEKGGTMALVEPSAEGWTEAGRFKLPRESKLRKPSGGLWTHPAIANGRLFIRDQELLHCYDVKR